MESTHIDYTWRRSRAARRRTIVRVLAALTAVLLVLVLALLSAVSWYYSGQVLSTDRTPVYPNTATPLADGRVGLKGADQHYVSLAGQYGLAWDGGYAGVGQVVQSSPDEVVRTLTPRHGELAANTPVLIDLNAFDGDPKTARGLEFEDVSISTELGPMPAWFVPAAPGKDDDTWAIFSHGRGSSRAEALRILPTLHAAGLPTLVVSYRNDVGAPSSPDHLDHLGDTEWRDVDAGARWALGHGAKRLVLVGFSLGGAISLQLADRSTVRNQIVGLVLDCPVIDFRDVLRGQGAQRNLPASVTALATWTVERRIGVNLDRFDWVSRSAELSRPMLVIASGGDTTVPPGPAQRLAELRPDVVTLDYYPNVEHIRAWNVDPTRYEKSVSQWVAALPGG